MGPRAALSAPPLGAASTPKPADVPPETVVRKGRLQPGRMFLVDTAQGRIVEDEEIKRTLATARPYREWLDEHLIHVDDPPPPPGVIDDQ